MSISNHQRRWEPLFGKEPWWEMHLALLEGPGSDWEGAHEALERQMYDLATARGYDTTQVCPRCAKVADEHTSFGEDGSAWDFECCAECRKEAEEDDAREAEAHDSAQRNTLFGDVVTHLFAALLGPLFDIDDFYDSRLDFATIRMMMDGLVARDVQ